MIIMTQKPYSKEEVSNLREQFDTYIKTVIDVEKRICVAGMDRHYEGEEILLKDGSKQSNIWGGGIDLDGNSIEFTSFINIRPNNNNTSQEIQSADTRSIYKELTRFFFGVLYVK